MVILKHWKILLLLAYGIAVPLYFYQSTKGIQKALDASRESSDNQIKILKTSMEDQRKTYDKMFDEYRAKMEAEEVRYQQEIDKIKQTQVTQQKQLSKRFKENPSEIDNTLMEKYGLNAN
jgi:ABC-type transport system involved in cytochrome bd biosynthesis fused ATPase/permease subunit